MKIRHKGIWVVGLKWIYTDLRKLQDRIDLAGKSSKEEASGQFIAAQPSPKHVLGRHTAHYYRKGRNAKKGVKRTIKMTGRLDIRFMEDVLALYPKVEAFEFLNAFHEVERKNSKSNHYMGHKMFRNTRSHITRGQSSTISIAPCLRT